MINSNFISINDYIKRTNPAQKNKISFYYYSDTHGNTDEMAGILTSAKAFKKKMESNGDSFFMLSAGDNFTGADAKKNKFFVDLMQNYIGVNVSAVGNHECDGGSDGFIEAAANSKIEFIGTNVNFANDNPMKDVVKKSLIKEQNGLKIGFIGTLPLDLKTVAKEDAIVGIDVMGLDDTIKALQSEIDNLKKQGVNKIVLLSHVGYDLDKQLAQNLDGVDVIVGGHTHLLVEGVKEGENLLKSKSGEPVVITQAGENAKYYGILDVEFDNSGVLKRVNNTVVQNPNTQKSPVIEQIKAQNLGISPEVCTVSDIDPMPPNRRIEPCAWTELMTDAVRNELGTQIALINSANIRKVPKAGSVTERDIQESAPMKNMLLKTKITQKQLVDGIKAAAKQTMTNEDGFPGLIQASGITYKIDTNGELLELNILDDKGQKNPVDINNPSDTITYSAAYDTFFARADGETPEFAPKFEVEQFDYDKDTATINYISKLEKKENLSIKLDGRLEIIQAEKQQPKGTSTRKFLGLTSLKAS